jgi:outer membrane receptor protein involved in Fe transport
MAALGAWAPALAASDQAPAAAASPASGATVSEIVVTARRLNEARVSIQPQIGASVYTITSKAIAAMPGGANSALNQVVLQSPGVTQDSFGQLHVRGEHNGLQFRLNGVILPEGLTVFSQALNPRLADKVQLITGALPAQYGLRTAGIIDIASKTGLSNGGDVSLYGGSQGRVQPSFEYGGGSGATNVFVSASYLGSDVGIESPDGRSTPIHDHTDQYQGFAYVDHILDANDRVSLILGASHQTFQIPNIEGQTPSLFYGPQGDEPLVVHGQTAYPSEALNENQREITYYGVGSWLRTVDKLTTQISFFARYSSLHFTPDPLGDLLFTGTAQDAFKEDVATGVQAEAVYKLTRAHTLRGGVVVQIDRSVSRTGSQVIALDPETGSQVSDQPVSIHDNSAKTGKTASVYAQDEWKLFEHLTLNYGLRFDQFDGYRDENQVSPRINAVWSPFEHTTVHLGYSRYFSPPPFELVGAKTVNEFLNTTGATPSTRSTTPYAERANYYDIGVSQVVTPGLVLGVDTYYKTSKHLVDEGQFGAPIILTPFNYEKGIQYGVEAELNYTHRDFTAYANFAYAKNQGKNIVSSEFNFTEAELVYIARHYIYLDHDQTYSVSAGASYLWHGTRLSTDLIYGSGLRATGDDGIPNGVHLPGYVEVNFGLSHRFEKTPAGAMEARLDVVNAFDEIYKIRDGTGVGVGAPQYGARRGVFVGLTKYF